MGKRIQFDVIFFFQIKFSLQFSSHVSIQCLQRDTKYVVHLTRVAQLDILMELQFVQIMAGRTQDFPISYDDLVNGNEASID